MKKKQRDTNDNAGADVKRVAREKRVLQSMRAYRGDADQLEKKGVSADIVAGFRDSATNRKYAERDVKFFDQAYRPLINVLKGLNLRKKSVDRLLIPVIRSGQLSVRDCRQLSRWVKGSLRSSLSSTAMMANFYCFAKTIWVGKFKKNAGKSFAGKTYDDFVPTQDLKEIAAFLKSEVPKLQKQLKEASTEQEKLKLQGQIDVITSNPEYLGGGHKPSLHAKFSSLKSKASSCRGAELNTKNTNDSASLN